MLCYKHFWGTGFFRNYQRFLGFLFLDRPLIFVVLSVLGNRLLFIVYTVIYSGVSDSYTVKMVSVRFNLRIIKQLLTFWHSDALCTTGVIHTAGRVYRSL